MFRVHEPLSSVRRENSLRHSCEPLTATTASPTLESDGVCVRGCIVLLRDVPFSTYPRPKVSLSAMAIPRWGHSSANWREAVHHSIGL